MTNIKISEYDGLNFADNADLVEIVDVSDTSMASTGTNKKITIEKLSSVVGGIPVASLAGIQDTNVIKYNSSTQQFEPGAASVVANLNDLNDVTITTPATGEALMYDGANWKNEAISGASIITNEIPTGLVNSSNTVYTTAHDFVATKISIYLNRTRLKLNEDYTETAANEVTLTVAPTTGDDIWVDYVRSDTVLIGDTSYQRVNETPTGLVNGSNQAYDTAEPYIAGTLQVFLNGQLQALTINYTETDSNTFTMVTAPLTDDTLRVTYQTTLTPAGNADTLDGSHLADIQADIDAKFTTPGALTSWSPTISGYSSNPTGGLYFYEKIGKLVYLSVREPNNGTSNATTTTLTLPFTAVTKTNASWIGYGTVIDNGVAKAGSGAISSGGTTISFFSDNVGTAAFTNSGSKRISTFNIIYEAV